MTVFHPSSATERVCYCCGRDERRLWPLIQSDKGLVCACDPFCRVGTDKAIRDLDAQVEIDDALGF